MESKRGNFLFIKLFLVFMIIVLINLGFLIYKNPKIISFKTTGFSIRENLSEVYYSLSSNMKLFLLAQWIILMFVIIYIIFQIKKSKKNIQIKINKTPEKNKTDLDLLYEIIQEKKEIPFSLIPNAFNVSKEIAMEWCKILESGELISIEYNPFGEPIIKIK